MTQKPASDIVEIVPSLENEISGIASANAPFIYFENVPFHGTIPGIGKLTLTTQRNICGRKGRVQADNVIVAHLAGNLLAIKALRDSCDAILAMNEKPIGPGN